VSTGYEYQACHQISAVALCLLALCLGCPAAFDHIILPMETATSFMYTTHLELSMAALQGTKLPDHQTALLGLLVKGLLCLLPHATPCLSSCTVGTYVQKAASGKAATLRSNATIRSCTSGQRVVSVQWCSMIVRGDSPARPSGICSSQSWPWQLQPWPPSYCCCAHPG